MLHKQFSIRKIYQVKINSKFVTNIKHIEPWLNDKYFNHINKVVIGAIIIMKSIIYDPQNNVITIKVQLMYF
jgi:hypothetical protein